MNRDEIKGKLITLCAEIFTISIIDKEFIEKADFINDLGMDSITFITLVVEIENTFNITIDDNSLRILMFTHLEDISDIIYTIINATIENDD